MRVGVEKVVKLRISYLLQIKQETKPNQQEQVAIQFMTISFPV